MKARVIAYDDKGVSFSVVGGRAAGLTVTWSWYENDVPVPFGPPPVAAVGPRTLQYGIYPYYTVKANGWEKVIVEVRQGSIVFSECGRWSVPDKKTGKVSC